MSIWCVSQTGHPIFATYVWNLGCHCQVYTAFTFPSHSLRNVSRSECPQCDGNSNDSQDQLGHWTAARFFLITTLRRAILFSKKSPTGPTERTPNPEYLTALAATSNLLRGPLVRSNSIFDGYLQQWPLSFESQPGIILFHDLQFYNYGLQRCRLFTTTKLGGAHWQFKPQTYKWGRNNETQPGVIFLGSSKHASMQAREAEVLLCRQKKHMLHLFNQYSQWVYVLSYCSIYIYIHIINILYVFYDISCGPWCINTARSFFGICM